jgi:hypothetical protein
MSRETSPASVMANAGYWWQLLAYPRLREIPRTDWPAALRRARAIDLDLTERLGIVAGIGFTTYALGSVGADAESVLAHTLLQFACAVPLLGLLVGPLLLRRTRRGLDLEATHRNGGDRCTDTTFSPARKPSESGRGS